MGQIEYYYFLAFTTFYYWSVYISYFPICLPSHFHHKSASISARHQTPLLPMLFFHLCRDELQGNTWQKRSNLPLSMKTPGCNNVSISGSIFSRDSQQSNRRGARGSAKGAAGRVVPMAGSRSPQGQGEGSGFPCCTWRIHKWGYFSPWHWPLLSLRKHKYLQKENQTRSPQHCRAAPRNLMEGFFPPMGFKAA